MHQQLHKSFPCLPLATGRVMSPSSDLGFYDPWHLKAYGFRVLDCTAPSSHGHSFEPAQFPKISWNVANSRLVTGYRGFYVVDATS